MQILEYRYRWPLKYRRLAKYRWKKFENIGIGFKKWYRSVSSPNGIIMTNCCSQLTNTKFTICQLSQCRYLKPHDQRDWQAKQIVDWLISTTQQNI